MDVYFSHLSDPSTNFPVYAVIRRRKVEDAVSSWLLQG